MARFRHPAVKAVVDRSQHKYSLGRTRPVFKKSAVGMEVAYWDDNTIKTATIIRLIDNPYGLHDKHALLSDGATISVGALVGVY